MSIRPYASRALVRTLYSDQARIASRGAFLQQHSNRKYSIRDLLRMLMADCPKESVLDFGCGNGSFLRSILPDPAIRIAFAQDLVRHREIATLPAKVVYSDAADRPFDVGTKVDLVFVMNVLYHLLPQDIASHLRRAVQAVNDGGSLFVTTKSANNFPVFRKLLDELGLEYGQVADEATFSVENAFEQVEAATLPAGFTTVEYPLVTQIVTGDVDAVMRYMLSCTRFSRLAGEADRIREKIRDMPLYVDSYFETIIHAKKPLYDK